MISKLPVTKVSPSVTPENVIKLVAVKSPDTAVPSSAIAVVLTTVDK